MSSGDEFLRYASPSEIRCIARENLGLYHAVIVGAIYTLPLTFKPIEASSYFNSLRTCVLEHANLSVVVEDAHTDKAFYRRVASIDLDQHTFIIQSGKAEDERASIGDVLRSNLDKPFPPGLPPWKIVVLPLQQSRCLIAFCYSHTIGDGATGVAFQRTFLKAIDSPSLNEAPAASVLQVPERQMAEPFDTPQRLPITWSFLLGPLLGVLLPGWMARLLGVRASASAIDKETWIGSKIAFDEHKGCQSRFILRELGSQDLNNALQVTKHHDAKLTAVLQEFIARALSRTLPETGQNMNFVCQTALNMRPACGISKDEMGNVVSGHYTSYARTPQSLTGFDEQTWARVRTNTHALAFAAAKLQDQPTGLLRYVPSIRKWTLSKLGKSRDCSFEVSNIGAHEFSHEKEGRITEIMKMIFTQPGHAMSAPLAFNFVGVKGSGLVYTVTWAKGALALSQEQDEEAFVAKICEAMEGDVAALR